MTRFSLPKIISLLVLAAAMPAAAAPIIGLFNTGVDNAGAALATGTADSHYSLVSSVSTTAFAGGTNGVFPIGPWIANTATASWITPTVTASDSFDPATPGLYTYTLQFDLTGYDPATALAFFDVGADNSVDVSLNGGAPLSAGGFTSLTSLGFTSGFVGGLNALTFAVTNAAQSSGNPTGLYVRFTQTDVQVPEPASLAVLGLGLAGLAGARRAKRRQPSR